MRTCESCGIEKAESHFRKFGRGLKKVCKACEGGGGTAVTADEPVTESNGTGDLIRIEPSMGARVRITGSLLEIEQDRVGEDGEAYTHTVTLYPHEARQVIEAVSTFVEKAA